MTRRVIRIYAPNMQKRFWDNLIMMLILGFVSLLIVYLS
jgi:hypothetical protein